MLQEQDYFKYQFSSLKEKYPTLLNTMQEYHLFVLLCMKNFYFNDGTPFDVDIALSYLTDGKNDGGIDAIFNDPNSEDSDVIIMQCKYYEDSKLSASNIAGELYKINETLSSIDTKGSEFNENLVTAYRNALNQKEESGKIKICFFTSYEPKNKRERTKLEKTMADYFPQYEYELFCRTDIEAQIDICENGKVCVDYDKLKLDRKNNYLSYEDSVIVNISARSLQDLQNRRRNGLLGMNLRYYVKNKDVDDGIQRSITKDSENFWYKNNGIIIVCDDYEIDGNILKLWEFSIVNGGQTTNRIGCLDIEDDFYLQCKVVKSKGESEQEKDNFIHEIAKATNFQKPIKKSDIQSNSPEQARLKERLSHYNVYYMTKKGDSAPKQYSLPYQVTSIEKVGKVCLAGVLQMPGSARSSAQKMYNETEGYYQNIFGSNAKAGVIADLLRISYYYDRFLKINLKDSGYDEYTLAMIKNGRTFQIAALSLLCKIEYGVFTYDSVANSLNNVDDLKRIIRSTGNMEKLIMGKPSDEELIFFELFSVIGEDVLGYCYESAVERAENEDKKPVASDYLKSDTNYYKDVIKRLWSQYNKKSILKKAIYILCDKK